MYAKLYAKFIFEGNKEMNVKAEITTAIILEERTPKSDGTYPVKIRITYRRQQRYYKTGFSLSEEDFLTVTAGKPKGDLKTASLEINAKEKKAKDIIEALKNFTFDEFKLHFLGRKKATSNNAFEYLQNREGQFRSEERIKSAECCKSARNSLTKFYGRSSLPFENITPKFLWEYEKWMLEEKNSNTTIGIYLRELRAVMNHAVGTGHLERSSYPFGKYGYTIPTGRNVKKALLKAELKKIWDYKPTSIGETKALAFWKFSYLCNGLNMKDLALLKRKNINGDMIYFSRAKTKRSIKSDPIVISAHLTTYMKDIIKKWGSKENESEEYIFPILDNAMSASDIEKHVHQFIKTTNENLKRIGTGLNLRSKLTSGVARHSYATILRSSGTPIAYIGATMGHSNSKTTENYFAGFEDEDTKQYSSALTGFLKEPRKAKKVSQAANH